MFGSAASVEADAGAVGHLLKERKETTELRRHSDDYFVDESRHEVVGILECVAEWFETFAGGSSALIEIGMYFEEFAINGISYLIMTNEFVIHVVDG